MNVIDCPLEGLKVIELNLFGDNRGFFVERFHAKRFGDAGLPTEFSQDNHSRSAPGILRGVHYQHTPAQGKLVGVTSGKVWDVAVDLRPDSKTYGKYHAVELTENRLFWIPAGFGHGFCVLGDQPADMLYKVTGLYNKDGEGGVKYDDPDLAIEWPIHNPIISERDTALMSFADYKRNPPHWA